MSKLKQILTQINETKAIAATQVPSEPLETYNNRLANQKNAIARLDQLFLDYRKEAVGNSFFILTCGKNCKKFADASKEFGCTAFGGKSVYLQMVSGIHESSYLGKQIGAVVFDHIAAQLHQLCIDIDIASYPALMYNSKYAGTIKTAGDLERLIETVLDNEIGTELVVYSFIHQAAKEVINKNMEMSVIPIVVHTDDVTTYNILEKAINKLKMKRFTVGAGQVPKDLSPEIKLKDVETEGVEKVLQTILSKIV